MGNTSSNLKEFIKNFEEKVKEIMKDTSWEDMQKMENPKECDKILALTTNIYIKI